MLSLPALTRLRHPLPEGEGSLDQIHSHLLWPRL